VRSLAALAVRSYLSLFFHGLTLKKTKPRNGAFN
jgi:hypothetical protein